MRIPTTVEDPPVKRLGDGVKEPKVVAAALEVEFGSGARAVHALGPFDVTVADGEFLCVVGPSGCGKSTFVRVIAGLQLPTAGTVQIRLDSPGNRGIATVFQDFGIFPWKTVTANVEFGLRTGGVPKREARARARDWLKRLGLLDFADSYPAKLSGGMRQRVSIARALAVEPEILLMDEPFASLDAQLREILQEELLTICQSEQRTVVFVTHSLEEAIVLADRVVVMTARPGRALDVKQVPFARPRDVGVRESAAFGHLRAELWEHLKVEVNEQFRASAERRE